MSRPRVHSRHGTAYFNGDAVPLVLCERLFVDEASWDDGEVTCNDCKRLIPKRSKVASG